MKKTPQRTEKKFQDWWNNHFFNTDLPYYRTYKDLYDAGADLDYIYFLHRRIESEDAFSEVIREGQEANRKGRRKQKLELPAAHREMLASLADGYAKGYVEAALERGREINPEDPLMSLPLLRPLSPPFFPPLTPRDQLDAAQLRQFEEEVAERALKHAQQRLRERLEQEQKKRNEGNKSIIKKSRSMGIFQEYLPDPRKYRKGGRQDLRGSFFLLAVTEHLKERCRKPHYLLAAKLLKQIRRASKILKTRYWKSDSLSQERTRAMMRVQQLKKSHRDWETNLALLKKRLVRERRVNSSPPVPIKR